MTFYRDSYFNNTYQDSVIYNTFEGHSKFNYCKHVRWPFNYSIIESTLKSPSSKKVK